MNRPGEPSTREQIVLAADRLFYQRGFEHTSFADIAAEVRISRGNFWHHFRSKDDILAAVVDLRIARTRAMLDGWAGRARTPTGRLRAFARMLIDNHRDIARFGCPVGTLCAELAKLDHPAHPQAAMIFGQFRAWLREQFEQLGRGADADALAMHLLARSQGIAALANTFRDEAFVRHEVALIGRWLQALAPGRHGRAPHQAAHPG